MLKDTSQNISILEACSMSMTCRKEEGADRTMIARMVLQEQIYNN